MPTYILTYAYRQNYRIEIEADSPAEARTNFLIGQTIPGCYPQFIDEELLDDSFVATPMVELEVQR